jgi:cell wall-associated NlpC family hydrolase
MNPARLFTYLVMRCIQLFDPPILRTKGLVYDSEAARRLKPGDILLWRGSKGDPLAAAIMLFTDSPYSHAELYMGGGWSIGSEVNGVGYNPAMGTGRNLSPPTEAWVDALRFKEGLAASQLQALLGAAESQLDKPYGIVDGVLGFPWPGKRARTLRSTYASYGCSELVSYCFERAGARLSPNEPPYVAPADLAHSPNVEYVCSVYGGRVLDKREYFNRLDPEIQGEPWHELAQFVVKELVEPSSKRDEFYERPDRVKAWMKAQKNPKPSKAIGV